MKRVLRSDGAFIAGPPRIRRAIDRKTKLVQYRARCSWCKYDTLWCISWIAVWRFIAEHFFTEHRSEQAAVMAAWDRAEARAKKRP